MKNFKVIAAFVNFHSGVLKLDEKQAKLRSHNLKPLGKGLYEVHGQVQFKRGEEFGFDGQLPKALVSSLEPEEAGADLDSMDKDELLKIALERFGIQIHPRTGVPKIIEQIKAAEAEAEERAKAAEARTARIAELEAKGDDTTEDEKVELLKLYEEAGA